MTTTTTAWTVQYTVAKTVKGEFKNLYKSRTFTSYSDAVDFANSQRSKSNVTDVRVF